jgi:hypothetical protein
MPLILCFLVFFQVSAQATELKFKNYQVKNSETLMLIAFNGSVRFFLSKHLRH